MKKTQISQTQIQDSLDTMQRGRPSGMHEWSSTRNQWLIKQKPNQRPIEEQVIESRRSVWVSVQGEKRRQREQAVDIMSSFTNSYRWLVTMTPTQLTHSLEHMSAHTHTQRSIRVGYMSDPYTQVHDVQLTSDSQLIGQIKQWIKKRNETNEKKKKKKDHNSASIKWPLSRSTYQHFLGCWLIDKCCQSHTENKTKQKLQNDSIFSQQVFSPSIRQRNTRAKF